MPVTSTKPFPAPTTIDVERISGMPEPVLRNLLITQCYSELAQCFTERTGVFANWCSFATWASKQAGQTIRQEDLQRSLLTFVKNDPAVSQSLSLLIVLAKNLGAKGTPEQLHHSVLVNVLQVVASRASVAVARGNKKVFEEIAYQFARFFTLCYHDKQPTPSHLDEMMNGLKQGPPPDGQVYLQRAFTHYYGAFFEEDEKKKQELCFLANLEIGVHEQTRLQPEIAEALNAAFLDPDKIKEILRNRLFAQMSAWSKILLWAKGLFGKTSLLAKAMDVCKEEIETAIRRLLTHHLMILTLPPNNRLSLGRDLTATFPDHLKALKNTDLVVLLKEFDPTPDSLVQSGATDWANLKERMHFITDLFRCYHCSSSLFLPAFTAEQMAVLKAGKIPPGDL